MVVRTVAYSRAQLTQGRPGSRATYKYLYPTLVSKQRKITTMDETIRDRIIRRVRRCMAIALGGWILPAFSMGLIGAASQIPGRIAGAFYLTGFIISGGAVLAARRTLCAACSEPIGKMIGMSVAFPFLRKPANFCPYCGVHLDKPVSVKPIS